MAGLKCSDAVLWGLILVIYGEINWLEFHTHTHILTLWSDNIIIALTFIHIAFHVVSLLQRPVLPPQQRNSLWLQSMTIGCSMLAALQLVELPTWPCRSAAPLLQAMPPPAGPMAMARPSTRDWVPSGCPRKQVYYVCIQWQDLLQAWTSSLVRMALHHYQCSLK